MRATDLIFNYVVSSWLMGQDPPAFDILAWNGDSTRMSAAMHSFYLRSLYMRNELVAGELELGDYAGASPDTWRAAASKHKGSWWEDWTAWSDARAGAHVKPPPLGSKRHPALGDAPGEYVRG